MDELLVLTTRDWDLTICGQGVAKRIKSYDKVSQSRKLSTQASNIRLSPKVQVYQSCVLNKPQTYSEDIRNSISLDPPIFFENTQYQFEWVFNGSVTNASINHKLARIQQNFRFTATRGVPRLFGTIDTTNDLGWLRLPLEYTANGRLHNVSISLEVLPTKIAMHQDLPAMYKAIDVEYPLWRFSMQNATEQEASSSGDRTKFPLMWLAQFEQLRESLSQGLKIIANAPHNCLQPVHTYKQADKIKGRIHHKLAEKIRHDLNAEQFSQRYRVERKVLSVDTPENRFVKNIVRQSKRILEQLHSKLLANNKKPDIDVFSDAYLTQVASWQAPLQKMLKQPFMQEVGEYKDVSKTSLVLQQKTGYAAVYRIWQELKLYLNVFDNHATISARSIAQIYEVWCFITLRNLLVSELGFTELESDKATLIDDGLERRFGRNSQGFYSFRRADNTRLKLWHEPSYGHKSEPLKIFTEKQRPDIVLEATFSDGTQAYWLFDAKYRIDAQTNKDGDTTDKVPPDAINQMHRYRDAIIFTQKDHYREREQKSRPVAGGFTLYPGYFDQKEGKASNPYTQGIEQVGIGAFALLPSQGGRHAHWLTKYLIEQLGAKPVTQNVQYNSRKADALYVREVSRIPYHGMKQVRYSNLVMTARIGNNRSPEYVKSFKDGSARHYHMPVSTFSMQFGSVLVDEVHYLAIAYFEPEEGEAEIAHVWPVKCVKFLPRKNICISQAGAEYSDSRESYYLFELGKSVALVNKLEDVPCAIGDRFRASMKLVSLDDLQSAQSFFNLHSYYIEQIN